jgi:hypothetical protein
MQHRRLILLTFADDDDTAEGDCGQVEPHLVDRRFVAALLVTLAGPAAGGQGRRLGDSHQVQTQVPVEQLVGHGGRVVGHRVLLSGRLSGGVPRSGLIARSLSPLWGRG